MRPFRPNPFEGDHVRIDPVTRLLKTPGSATARPWLTSHVKQETLKERTIRMRNEAGERQKLFDALPLADKIARNPKRADHYTKLAAKPSKASAPNARA